MDENKVYISLESRKFIDIEICILYICNIMHTEIRMLYMFISVVTHVKLKKKNA